MNEEDGYAMVDETFGVREVSDTSDTDLDSPLPVDKSSSSNSNSNNHGRVQRPGPSDGSPESTPAKKIITAANAAEIEDQSVLSDVASSLVRVVPASPGDMLKEAAATPCAPAVQNSLRNSKPRNTERDAASYTDGESTKAVTLRLLPERDGGCSFSAVIPRSGEGSLASLGDLERELQLRLGLLEPVRLGNVQVDGADAVTAADEHLSNALDGSIIAIRLADQVLVRARACHLMSSPEVTPVQAFPIVASSGEKFVALSLTSSLTEAVDSVRDALSIRVPAGSRLELTRESPSSAAVAAAATIASEHSGGGSVPLSGVRDLCNGDKVVLCVVQTDGRAGSGDATASAAAGAATAAGMPNNLLNKNTTNVCNDLLSVGEREGRRHSTPPWQARGVNARENGEQQAAVDTEQEATALREAAVDHLVAAPAQLRPLPPSPLSNWRQTVANGGGGAVAASAADDEDDAAIAELVGMGFDREHVVGALRVCGRGESWKEEAISLLLEPQMSASQVAAVEDIDDPEMGLGRHMGERISCAAGGEAVGGGKSRRSRSPVKPSTCPICLSDIPQEEAFTVSCNNQHVFCLDCLYEHCSVQLLDSGLIPACPLSNMTCGHELSQEEVERVFLLRASFSSASASAYAISHKSSSGGSNSKVSEGASAAATAEQEKEKRALDTCRTLMTRRGLESTGAIPCVSAECGNWMVPEQDTGNRVRCGSCLTEFCLRCKRAPYHYAADCSNVVGLAREWAHWLSHGKGQFLRVMAAQDDQHQRLLDAYQHKKNEHDLAVKEAERVRADYDKMEDWKERRCRLCPSCGRTIEKISGCDMMMCGMDAHGGNVQNGCGARFVWSAAQPYVGDRGTRKEMSFTEAEPQAAARAKHWIARGIPLRCDRCHRDVVGPLFRCIHCPSFACCLECQDAACRDPRHVHHIFHIIGGDTDSDMKAPGVPAVRSGNSAGVACDMDVDTAVGRTDVV